MLGSVLGGWWSDRELHRLTRANGGHPSPEVQYPFLDIIHPAFKFLSDEQRRTTRTYRCA